MKKLLLIFIFSCFGFIVKAQSSTIVDSLPVRVPEIFDRAEVMPTFPGGVAELMKYLSKNIRYPKVARENGLEGKVIVKFYIDVDGSVKEPEILKDNVGGGAAEESIRVIDSMPNWTPGLQKGIPVKVFYVLPITFKLTGAKFQKNKSDDAPSSENSTAIFSKMEPMFPGGNVQLEFYKQDILSKIKKSPKEEAQKTRVEVMVNFDDLGKVSSVFVIKDNTDNLDNINIIIDGLKAMPNWYPAMKNGNTVISQKILIFEY
jgi:TonB family protein